TTSTIRTKRTSLTSKNGERPASSCKSNGVPKPATYLPPRLFRFVASSNPKLATCVVVCVFDVASKRKKFIPSLLTSTKPNSKNAKEPEAKPFSNTAKSAPDPLRIGLSKPNVICPPSPKLTTP